ncbi:HNH endonuclease [Frigidibacter sp. MR17.14]|uniref:HNH endonuclease n=1 Tax=Frigidibacter sp. MR17.14 TaxID=3126509 RepID=UPI00301314A8
MLISRRELIARELAEGTGATIAVGFLDGGLRRGLRIWFDDLDDKHGPVAELRPYGLKSHQVQLAFGPFSARVLATIRAAEAEDIQLARSLVRSVARIAEVAVTGQHLTDWTVADARFGISATFRHHTINPDTDEAVIMTCREVLVPLMAAMAELIGYDVVEDATEADHPAVEGALSRATVNRRERNPRNRLLCLRIHGLKCRICGTDPKVVYGSAGGIIEVHHLEPVAMLHEPRPYDPEVDLVPLCPNCHRAVHTRRPWPYSPEELMLMMGIHHG